MYVNSPRRLAAYDRRGAAVHEAGHVVVAEFCGFHAVSAWIAPNEEARDDKFKKTWIGRVQYLSPPRDPLHRRMIACAGATAEMCWRGEYPMPEFWEDPDTMSPTDWAMAGCEPGTVDDDCFEAIERVAHLLECHIGPLWPSLVAKCRWLICDARA